MMADLENTFEKKVEISDKFGKEAKRPKTQTIRSPNREKRGSYMVKKRLPPKPDNRPNDVYIGEKSNFQVIINLTTIISGYIKIFRKVR